MGGAVPTRGVGRTGRSEPTPPAFAVEDGADGGRADRCGASPPTALGREENPGPAADCGAGSGTPQSQHRTPDPEVCAVGAAAAAGRQPWSECACRGCLEGRAAE